MAVIALLPHPARPAAADLADDAAAWLAERGHDVRRPDGDLDGLDLAVSLGGDGTMLYAVQLVCGDGVPVLGVNVGNLGYLTTVEPAHLIHALERFLAGDYKVEDRMMLSVRVRRGGDEVVSATALNECVLEKTTSGHTVHLAIGINERPFMTAAADGMIVSTPTGSTAYNFSARGPIVSPLHRAVIVTPVSPHMLFDRALVLDPNEAVDLEVLDDRDAIVVVDGRNLGTLVPGDVVQVTAAKHDAHFVTFDDGRDFHQILKAKFKLADR